MGNCLVRELVDHPPPARAYLVRCPADYTPQQVINVGGIPRPYQSHPWEIGYFVTSVVATPRHVRRGFKRSQDVAEWHVEVTYGRETL